MRSEFFEETLKQHKDSLTDELEKLGKHRQAQLVEWDIEQNESDYEFYFIAGWNAQQFKVDDLQKQLINQGQRFNDQAQRVKDLEHKNGELQKRVDASLIAFEKLKEEINQFHGQCDLHLIKYLEEKAQVLEQALKGGSNA